MTTISLCMIVKNEEEVLARAVNSASGAYDELIIVDTGSTDRTVEIAEELGARVLHYEWIQPGHKGEARMIGIDAATSDWILVLDADEILMEPSRVRAALESLDDNVGSMVFKFVNVTETGERSLEWFQTRAFRRGQYRYVHREHEIPIALEYVRKVAGSDLVIQHRPPADRAVLKVGAMLQRLELDVEERPDDFHAIYMLARQYVHAERWSDAIAMVDRYLALDGQKRVSDACLVAAIASDKLNYRSTCFEWLYRAAAHEPHRRRWWLELAHAYAIDGDWMMADRLAHLVADLPLRDDQRETLPMEHDPAVWKLLAECRAHYHVH